MGEKRISETDLLMDRARETLSIESSAVESMLDRIGNDFIDAVELITSMDGRLVLTGMGKSGAIGRKLTATFASIGTPAFFMHPAEGLHGDLGMITKEDVVLAISYSGQTEEVKSLLPPLERIGPTIISMTSDPESILAEASEVMLDISVEQEAGPLDLAPTASSTATLALGDALAMVVAERNNLNREDFARYHPGGSLGKRLLIKVKDLMRTGDEIPIVSLESSMKKTLFEMTQKRMGITGVVDEQNQLIGCLTDGDLRRILEDREGEFFDSELDQVMTRDPLTISEEKRAVQALELMEENEVTVLFIVDDNTNPFGAIHMHDILKEGIQSSS